jgi:hypothetical protein
MEGFNDSPDDEKKLDSTHEMNQKRGSLEHGFNDEFDETVNKIFPAEFVMIGGSADYQISLDVSQLSGNLENGGYDSQQFSLNLSTLRNEHFSLPKNFDGRSGGACTAALLSCLYKAHENNQIENMSWVSLLKSVRGNLVEAGFDQVPQLSSTRFIDINKPFRICNEDSNGTKRAVMIGINYVGQKGELSGCHADVKRMITYLKDYQGFEDKNITVLIDDGNHETPTFRHIMNAYRKVARQSKAGDTVFLHYSGHGGRIRDRNGDENDGYDETIIPSDYFKAGQIVDDYLCEQVVKAMRKGVLVTSIMDCCHSGTVLDLPYRYEQNGHGMDREHGYKFKNRASGWCSCFGRGDIEI